MMIIGSSSYIPLIPRAPPLPSPRCRRPRFPACLACSHPVGKESPSPPPPSSLHRRSLRSYPIGKESPAPPCSPSPSPSPSPFSCNSAVATSAADPWKNEDGEGEEEEEEEENRSIHHLFSSSAVDSSSSSSGRQRQRHQHQHQQRKKRRSGMLALVQSFMPGGNWWRLTGPPEEETVASGRGTLSEAAVARRLWALVKHDWIILSIAFAALIVAALSEIAIPHYVAATIFSAQSGAKERFLYNARLLALMSCTFGFFSGLRGGCFGVVNQSMVRRMREQLFSTLLSQDIAFFDREAIGALTSRLGSDCQQVSRIIGNDLNIMLRNLLQGLGSLLYLVSLSRELALSTAIISFTMFYSMVLYGRYQRSAAKAVQDTMASANEVAEETLSLARVVRTFGTEQEEVARYNKWSGMIMDINLRQTVAYGFWNWSSNTLYHATQVVALLIGGAFVMVNRINTEQLTKFILYSEWVVHATWWVGDHWASLMQSIGASEKVFELMDLPPSQQLTSQGLQLTGLKGNINFKDISFHYPSRPQVSVMRNVNLCIGHGEIVAVVGLSGSGKSTIVSLLLRLYEPTSGDILIDGISLKTLDIKWFRQQIGVVSQEPQLFSMDIASNIAYGCGREASLAEIQKAAKKANAHDFITSFPNGYKTVVDNSRLSGGQKQRIAIARAFLRDPVILILDEATSALDAESEHLVKNALTKFIHGEGKRRTVLIIAHRLSTVQAADKIIVMQHGRIVEVGTHQELVEMDGEYAKLTRRQRSAL